MVQVLDHVWISGKTSNKQPSFIKPSEILTGSLTQSNTINDSIATNSLIAKSQLVSKKYKQSSLLAAADSH
jgi:hypothetical protein